MPSLTAVFHEKNGINCKLLTVRHLIIAGWTGRDKATLEKHILELERLGVQRPASTPIFYRVSTARITTGERIEVSGEASTGEVEFILLNFEGRLWIGVGSDHTDRHVETYSVTVSKQMCEKPIAGAFWDFQDVADHWDALILRSHVVEGGKRILYQEGSVAAMLAPQTLLQLWNNGKMDEGTLVFGGTLALIGEIRPATRFEFELEDPILQRKLAGHYDIDSLTVSG